MTRKPDMCGARHHGYQAAETFGVGKEISQKAGTCPNCGAPSNMNNNSNKERYIVNPKIGKGKIVIGKILVFVGIACLFGETYYLAAFFLIVGFPLLIAGRFQNWWHWK